MLDRGLQFFDCGSVFNFTQVSGSLEITGFELKDGVSRCPAEIRSRKSLSFLAMINEVLVAIEEFLIFENLNGCLV